MYDPGEVIRLLESNDEPVPVNDCLPVKHYREFYNLDIEGAHHVMGFLQAGEHRVCVQKFSHRLARAGTVFMLHGYLDHSGLMSKATRRFLDRGFDVVLLDQPGHGLSSGDRASIDSFQHYVDCLARCVDFFADSDTPRIVKGHSMGGAIAMTYVLQNPGVFEKAILQAPLYRPKSWRLLRSLHFVGRPFVKHQPRKFVGNTYDLEYRHFIREVDPLSPKQIDMRWVTSMFDWTKHFTRLPKSDIDALVVQGMEDGTVDWQGNIKIIRRMFSNVRIHLVQEGRHNMLADHDEISDRAWEAIDPFLTGHRIAAG